MTILVLTPYVPYPPSFGGSVRIYHLMRQLSRQHRLILLSYRESESGLGDTSGLDDICDDVRCIDRDVGGGKRMLQLKSLVSPHSFQYHVHHGAAMQQALDDVIRERDVDLILVEFSQMACFSFPADIPVVIDQHNVEYDLIRRMAARSHWSLRKVYNTIEAVKYRREEMRALAAATGVLATSERDARLMRDSVPSLRPRVVVNGVDTAFFQNPGRTPRPNTLVFVGATHYFPNEDGIHFYMRDIHPKVQAAVPDITVTFVGGRPPGAVRDYASEQVVVTGFVDDVRPYMHAASVFIVPLRMGGGTRFKVVEALAAEVPVVSTRLGSEGIPVENGREVMLADRPDAFADAVVRILREPELAASLRTAGRELVRQRFDWQVIGGQLEEELRRIAGCG